MLSDEQINQIAAGVEAASGQKSNKNFNYVNITSKGCEGWINLFFGDEIIALIRNVHIANEIKKALSMAEKSRWKYPDKGELPEILSKYIIFYLNGSIARPRIGMAYKDKDGIFMFFCNDTKQGYPKTQVNAWTYAPVMEEG